MSNSLSLSPGESRELILIQEAYDATQNQVQSELIEALLQGTSVQSALNHMEALNLDEVFTDAFFQPFWSLAFHRGDVENIQYLKNKLGFSSESPINGRNFIRQELSFVSNESLDHLKNHGSITDSEYFGALLNRLYVKDDQYFQHAWQALDRMGKINIIESNDDHLNMAFYWLNHLIYSPDTLTEEEKIHRLHAIVDGATIHDSFKAVMRHLPINFKNIKNYGSTVKSQSDLLYAVLGEEFDSLLLDSLKVDESNPFIRLVFLHNAITLKKNQELSYFTENVKLILHISSSDLDNKPSHFQLFSWILETMVKYATKKENIHDFLQNINRQIHLPFDQTYIASINVLDKVYPLLNHPHLPEHFFFKHNTNSFISFETRILYDLMVVGAKKSSYDIDSLVEKYGSAFQAIHERFKQKNALLSIFAQSSLQEAFSSKDYKTFLQKYGILSEQEQKDTMNFLVYNHTLVPASSTPRVSFNPPRF